MEALIPELLPTLGIPGGAILLFWFMSRRIGDLEERLSKHINRHEAYEKGVCDKIDKLYTRLNPICDAVNKIQGYMEAQSNAKGK